jgi:hypothetical protein
MIYLVMEKIGIKTLPFFIEIKKVKYGCRYDYSIFDK